jgi:Ca2+/H+ antiporter
MRNFIRNPMNWLLVFIPAALVVDHLGHAPAALVFLLAALAIVPLAGMLVQATEQISHRTGPAIGFALFVAPVLVLISYVVAPKPMNLVFGNAGLVIIFLAVLITGMIASHGKSNWFKGVQLLCVYVLIALCCYFLPNTLETLRPGP